MAADQRLKFHEQPEFKGNPTLQRVVLNKNIARTEYRVCANVEKPRIELATTLLSAEVTFIIETLVTIYNWRCNLTTPRTKETDVIERFAQSITEFRFPVAEVAKRYTMRASNVFKDHVDAVRNWKAIDLSRFRQHLRVHAVLQVGNEPVRFWRTAIDDEGTLFLRLENNARCLQLVQFLNAIGNAIENLDNELVAVIKQGLHRNPAFKFS